MRAAILILIVFIQANYALSQPAFNKYYDDGFGGGGSMVSMNSIFQCHDGSVIGTGRTIGGGYFSLFKINSNGNPLWNYNYLTGWSTTGASQIQMLSDSTVLIYMYELLTSGIFLVKLDLSGNAIWSRLFNSTPAFTNTEFKLKPFGDGGCLIVKRDRQIFIDKFGNIISSFEFSGNTTNIDNLPLDTLGYRYLTEQLPTQFALFDYLNTGSSVNSNVITLLNDTLSSTTQYPANHITSAPAGGAYILMQLTGNNISVIKTDSINQPVWAKKISLAGNNLYRKLIETTVDGGCIIAGTAITTFGNIDPFVLKMDSSGNLLWYKMLGDWDYEYSYLNYLIPDGGSGFYGSLDDYYLTIFRVDSAFNGFCGTTPALPNISNLALSYSLVPPPSSNTILLTPNVYATSKITLSFTQSLTCIPTSLEQNINDNKLNSILVYPNPIADYINIEFIEPLRMKNSATMYNSIGEKMFIVDLHQSKTKIEFTYPPGLYLLEIKSDDEVYVKKITKL